MSDQTNDWIQELNSRVKQLKGDGLNMYEAVEQAASDFRLSVLSEGESCRIYESPDGMLVNCWLEQFVEGPTKPFDSQVGWYTSRSQAAE